MLAHLSVTDYLGRTASGDPVPGGGSAAALNAALAAGLIEMVARLTIGRKGFEAVDAEMRTAADRAAALRAKLTADIDRDSQAYSQVLAAFARPKATPEEKAARAQAIQEAFRQAALVPLGVARDALQAMALGRQVIAGGNPNAASDGAAGVLAARMAARAAVYNVKINLGSIKDERFTAELKAEADRLETEADALEAEALKLLKL
ncbi:MAG: cyclodeaminase/cyclohydrolase family protein [Desulfobacterales bacterium]|jgi:formiminotetrahydrofolate cyclodeaminase|nr:cyclodeaminase/cyclohydrolase family protein [Desulfobacterales bacterium]